MSQKAKSKPSSSKVMSKTEVAENIEQPPVEVPSSEPRALPKSATASVQLEQPQGEGDVQTTEETEQKETKKEQDKKKKKKHDLLSDEPLKFKKVGFEHALTPEEKAAKKAEKKAAKKKGKKKGEETPVSSKAEGSVAESDKVKSVDEGKEETEKKSKKEDDGEKGAEKKKKTKKEDGGKSEEKKKKKTKKEDGDKTEDKKKKTKKEDGDKSEDKKTKKGKKKISEKSDETVPSEVPKSDQVADGEKMKVEQKVAEGEQKDKDKKKKKGKKDKKDTEDSKASKESGESKSKGKGKPKKGKKDKSISEEDRVKESETAVAEQEAHERKKKTVSMMAIDQDEPDDDKKKKRRPVKSLSKISKSASRMSKSASRMSKSASGYIEEQKSSIILRSYSKSADFGGRRSSAYVTSSVSMASFPSDSMLSSMDVIGKQSTKQKGKDKKKQKGKKKADKKGSLSLVAESSAEIEDKSVQIKEAKETKQKKDKKEKKTDKKEKEAGVEAVPKEKEKGKEAKGEEKKQVGEGEKVEGEKGKKKKKKGKKSSETAEEPSEPQPVDIMAQIRMMKEQATAQAAGIVADKKESEEPPPKEGKKKKKGPKKKLSKAEKARLEMERLEQARIQAELDAQRAIEEERMRVEMEKKTAKEKERRETAEQALRVEQLSNSNALIKNMLDYNWNVNSKEKADFEWQQYLKCDGLPDPINPAQMNTYLHLWDQAINDVSVDEAKHRTNEIIGLLQVLEDFIDDPFDAPESLVADWKWVRALCREHQQENLDMATYRLLRDIDNRLRRIDIPTADFEIIDENFMLSLWLYVQLATPMYNPRAPQKKRLEIDFPTMKMNVLFPATLDTKCMAIRAVYVKYDHLSDTCATYDRPAMAPDIDSDLFQTTAKEWYTKMKYKYDNRPPPPKKMIQDAEGNMVEAPQEPEPPLPEGEVPPPVPYQKLEPTASQYAINVEDELYRKNRENLRLSVDDKVLNLRRYLIIGGIYHLDLFYQPPQPHDKVNFDVRLTGLQIPKRLYEVPFYIPYTPSQQSDPDVRKQPEELEEEMKRQEAEIDKLIMITLTLPDHVIFLDLPTVCHWDKDIKAWTTEDIHDLKHIEEKNYMTFRTGRFGPFALAVNRYINFPFQAWELKPEPDGTVTFNLTCAILMVEFHIKNNLICLTQLQNSPNNALQDIVGTYFKLPKLMKILQVGGIDLFPACDAFCYVEGTCEKHWPTERHLYYNMAQLSPSYNFAWSRWNSQAGRRNIVLQMREYRLDKPKQKSHSMLLVTPLKAFFIDTTEVSPFFNDTPIEGMKFYSDLYNLMKGTSSMSTRNKIQRGPLDVAKTLSDLLIMTRVLSFS